MGATFKEGLGKYNFRRKLTRSNFEEDLYVGHGLFGANYMEVLPLSLETESPKFIHSYSENGDSSFYRNACNDLLYCRVS
jgi:hypothetical protein